MRVASPAWRRRSELLIAVLLGALPSVAALSSGGQEWGDRLPIFVATAVVAILAFALFPASAWYLHRSDKVVLFGGLCLSLFLLALDMSGLVVVLGAEGEEVVFRRNGWTGASLFLTCVCYGLCVWIGQLLVRRHDAGREWIVCSLLAFGLVYCVARALWPAGGSPFPGADETGFINRNAFAHFALLHASLALGLLYAQGDGHRRRHGLRFLLLLCAGAFGLVAAATTSRGALVAWAIVLGGWLFLVRRSLVARGGFLGVVAMLALVSVAACFGPEVLARLQTEHMSFATRVAVWQKSLALSLQNPLFGFGPGSFSDAFNSRFDLGGMKVFTHAEQSYLTAAVEFGWVLLGLVAGWMFWNLWQAWRLRRDSWRAFCLVSLPLALFLLHGFVESLWRFPAILLVVSLVLALNRGKSTLPHRGTRRPAPGAWNLFALASGVVLLAAAGHGWYLQRKYETALRALDAGIISRAKADTEQALSLSLDERLWLMRLARRWVRYLDRTGVQDQSLDALARRLGDELIRRQPSNWESWMLWLWPRLGDKSQETEIVFGVRKALNCLSHWEPLYLRIATDLSRYAPDLLERIYETLPSSQQTMLWRSLQGKMATMNRPFLDWASAQSVPPDVESELLRAASQFKTTPAVVDSLAKVWQNPKVSWPERRAAGDRLLKSMPPEKWFAEFPPDLEDNLEAQLQRLNRGLQSQLTPQVKERLLAMKLPGATADRRMQIQFAELHVAAGLIDRAREICEVLLTRSDSVRAAEQRSRDLHQRYATHDPRAVADILWSAARVTAAQGSWLDLINCLLSQKDYPQAASALRQFPVAQQQEDERKEYLLYKARAADGAGKTQEAVATLVQLLYLENPK